MPEASRHGMNSDQDNKQGNRGHEKVVIATPLYAAGVEYARVYTPIMGVPPDPLGLLDPTGREAPFLDVGNGDDVQDWTDIFFGSDARPDPEPHQRSRLR